MWRTPRLRNRKIAPMQRVFFEELVMCKMVFAMWLYLETVSDKYIKYTVKQQILRQNTLFESIEYWLSFMTVKVCQVALFTTFTHDQQWCDNHTYNDAFWCCHFDLEVFTNLILLSYLFLSTLAFLSNCCCFQCMLLWHSACFKTSAWWYRIFRMTLNPGIQIHYSYLPSTTGCLHVCAW